MLFMYSQTFVYDMLCDSPILQLGAGSPTSLPGHQGRTHWQPRQGGGRSAANRKPSESWENLYGILSVLLNKLSVLHSIAIPVYTISIANVFHNNLITELYSPSPPSLQPRDADHGTCRAWRADASGAERQSHAVPSGNQRWVENHGKSSVDGEFSWVFNVS